MKDIKSKLLTTLKRYLAILHSISWCSHAQEIPHIFFSTYKKHENLYFKCTYRKVDNKLKRFYMEIQNKNHKTHLSIVACVFIFFFHTKIISEFIKQQPYAGKKYVTRSVNWEFKWFSDETRCSCMMYTYSGKKTMERKKN